MTSEPIPFKVSTSLKTIIGKELVTNEYIAIFELVKNSYDARAPHSFIIFKDVKSGSDSKIIIVDDGDGMSKSDLVRKWLFLGYSEKREEPSAAKKDEEKKEDAVRSKERHFFAGSKGIGRFSCDTLGAKLRLHTKTADDKIVHRLDIDWTSFELDQSKQFQTVNALYSTEKSTDVEKFDLATMGQGCQFDRTNQRYLLLDGN